MTRYAYAFIACAAAYGSLIGAPARAADLAAPAAVEEESLFDVAFGVAGLTDYRFRGISQTTRDPSIQGYVELSAFDWIYAGVWASNVNFPTRLGLTDPSSEVDLYAGVRHTWDAFTLDAGYLYYWYPGEFAPGPARQTDYWELKAAPSFEFGDYGSIAGQVWWTPDYANTGSNATYIAVLPKVNIPLAAFPDLEFYVSGEFGKQWLKRADSGFNPKDYLTWNIGGGVTYNAMTLDVRYSDTNLTKQECVGNAGSRYWCGRTVVGKIAFDTSLSKLK